MKHIAGDVYAILTQFGFLNTYVIKLAEGVALVDLGANARFVETIKAALAGHGWTVDDVRHILITHSHYDHVGGLAAIQRESNAPTYAHRLAAPVIRGEQPPVYARKDELSGIPRLMYGIFINSAQPATPARVDVELNDGDTLEQVYPELQVVHLPGHSHGQVGFWLANERTLIGGDVMIRTPFRLAMPLRVASPDWQQAKESIHRVGALPVDALCLGHGQPIESGASTEIAKLVQRVS